MYLEKIANKPIHYHIFPYNISEGSGKNRKEYKISTVTKQLITSIKKKGNIKFKLDEAPTEETYIVYADGIGVPKNVIESMIIYWMESVWEISNHNKMLPISELVEFEMENNTK